MTVYDVGLDGMLDQLRAHKTIGESNRHNYVYSGRRAHNEGAEPMDTVFNAAASALAEESSDAADGASSDSTRSSREVLAAKSTSEEDLEC